MSSANFVFLVGSPGPGLPGYTAGFRTERDRERERGMNGWRGAGEVVSSQWPFVQNTGALLALTSESWHLCCQAPLSQLFPGAPGDLRMVLSCLSPKGPFSPCSAVVGAAAESSLGAQGRGPMFQPGVLTRGWLDAGLVTVTRPRPSPTLPGRLMTS